MTTSPRCFEACASRSVSRFQCCTSAGRKDSARRDNRLSTSCLRRSAAFGSHLVCTRRSIQDREAFCQDCCKKPVETCSVVVFRKQKSSISGIGVEPGGRGVGAAAQVSAAHTNLANPSTGNVHGKLVIKLVRHRYPRTVSASQTEMQSWVRTPWQCHRAHAIPFQPFAKTLRRWQIDEQAIGRRDKKVGEFANAENCKRVADAAAASGMICS